MDVATPQAHPIEAGVVTDPRRQRLILIAMCTALVAVVASVSGLNVAQQGLAVDLGASQSTLLWIINGYTLALAALLLPIGAIGDRWGRKRVLVAGLVVFALANVAAAMSPSASFLLVARVVAGAGAAMIMPVTLSVITSSFPSHERAKAVGIWAGFAGAGGILGLFFSSVMVDYFSWPWVFAMPAVLSGVAFAITLVAVGESRENHAGRFDVGGSVLSALAIGALVLGIHEGPEIGWTAPLTAIGLIVGVMALVGFIAWELRQEHPLFDVRLLRDRGLSSGALNLMILFAVMFGLFLVLVQFLQAVLGYSALHASVGLLPDGAGDDALVGRGAHDRRAHRYAHHVVGRHRSVRCGVGHHGVDGVGLGWLLVDRAGSSRTRRGHGSGYDTLDHVDHRRAASGEARCGFGLERHRARVGWRAWCGAARLGLEQWLSVGCGVGGRNAARRTA